MAIPVSPDEEIITPDQPKGASHKQAGYSTVKQALEPYMIGPPVGDVAGLAAKHRYPFDKALRIWYHRASWAVGPDRHLVKPTGIIDGSGESCCILIPKWGPAPADIGLTLRPFFCYGNAGLRVPLRQGEGAGPEKEGLEL